VCKETRVAFQRKPSCRRSGLCVNRQSKINERSTFGHSPSGHLDFGEEFQGNGSSFGSSELKHFKKKKKKKHR
jgi:hypothetical protein